MDDYHKLCFKAQYSAFELLVLYLEQDVSGVHVGSHTKLASHLLSNEQLICKGAFK